MPLTKTELLYISLSLVAGAAIGVNWNRIRPLLSPLTKDLGKGCDDAFQEISAMFSSHFPDVFESDKTPTNSPSENTNSNTTCSNSSCNDDPHIYGNYPYHSVYKHKEYPSYFPRYRKKSESRIL